MSFRRLLDAAWGSFFGAAGATYSFTHSPTVLSSIVIGALAFGFLTIWPRRAQ